MRHRVITQRPHEGLEVKVDEPDSSAQGNDTGELQVSHSATLKRLNVWCGFLVKR